MIRSQNCDHIQGRPSYEVTNCDHIAIMRTFVQLRRLMDSNADLARKIEGLEKKYDEKFAVVFAAIKQLITPATTAPKRRIGFQNE
jgi:hypothetical protein